MPYVTMAVRGELSLLRHPRTAGELNYVLTRAILAELEGSYRKGLEDHAYEIIERYWLDASPQSYQAINDILGACLGCVVEARRRLVLPAAILVDNAADSIANAVQQFYEWYAAPYENRKIAENGDVYPKGG